uniref:CCHC-type domain-containing protein n=1 Tax=Tanacetum cinerariifolium TaxID=118510 RepID=A0A6L2NJG1_TANCI|nr:hypothetical protein [Tanacetum cinerariifolium]
MSTQQDIYAACSESRPPMLNKENYIPWSFHLLRYAKSRPNGKLIHNSILNGPYVRKMIPEPGNPAGYNDVIRNQVIQSAIQNPRVQNLGNPNGLMGVQGNGNQNQIRNGNLVAACVEGNAAGQNGNQIRCYNCRGIGHYARNCIARPRRRDAAYLQMQLLIAQKEEAGIQLQAEEYDLMAGEADLDDIEEVNANCILMANLQQASTLGTQSDSTPVYDTDGSAENDNDVVSEVTGVEQGGEIVEQHLTNFEETRALYDSLYHNLATEVEKVNSVNRKLKETNTELTTELARYKNQERCFKNNQEKYNKLEKCYQQSVYQEQCLSKKIKALHLSIGKQIMTLNEQFLDLNKQLSKEKSIVSFLLDEKKKLKADFKTCEDKLLDKQIQLEKKIKELNNIVFKTGQSIQTIHMLSPNSDSFYHTEHKMALGYQNPVYLKNEDLQQEQSTPSAGTMGSNKLFQSLRCKTSHAQLIDQKYNSFSAKSFGEDVRQLILCIDKIKFDHTIFNMLLDKVISDVDVL